MTKYKLYYNSAEDPLGQFVVKQDGEELDLSEAINKQMRKALIKNLLACILPF